MAIVLQPVQTKIRLNELGRSCNEICCPKLAYPGIDGEFCPKHRIWFVDEVTKGMKKK